MVASTWSISLAGINCYVWCSDNYPIVKVGETGLSLLMLTILKAINWEWMGRDIPRSSLARANQDRDYYIFEEHAYYLVNEARKKRATDIFKLDGNVYVFNSTTIHLWLSIFWWAKFRKKKEGIKVHTLYDVETQIPTFFHITEASIQDYQVEARIAQECTFGYGYSSDGLLS